MIWQSYDNQLEWFRLTDGKYQLLSPDPDIIRIRVFPGLWLAMEALLSNQMPQVLEVRSLEHETFVKQLGR